jgi:hypothetical protein
MFTTFCDGFLKILACGIPRQIGVILWAFFPEINEIQDGGQKSAQQTDL